MRRDIIFSLVLGAFFGIFFTGWAIVGYHEWLIVPGLLLLALVVNHVLIGSRFSGIRLMVSTGMGSQGREGPSLSDSPNRLQLSRYYSPIELSYLETPLQLTRTKWIIYVVGALSTFALLTLTCWIANLGSARYLETLLVLSGIVTGGILLGSYFGIPLLMQERKLEPETENLLREKDMGFYVLYIFCGAVLYLNSYYRGWGAGQVNKGDWVTFIFVLTVFPMYFINRLEGKFLFLFGLHQYFRVGSWDFFEGAYVRPRTVSVLGRTKVLMTRIGALIGLLGIIIGVIASLLGLVDIITSLITGLEPYSEQSFLANLMATLPGPKALYLLILGLGSLLTLITAPMGYIETWANQGVYDAFATASTEEEIIQTFAQTKGIRYPARTKEFGYNLLVVSSMMLSLVTFTALSSVLSTDYLFIRQGIWLAQRAGGVVFLASILLNLRNLNEERAVYWLAKKGKQLKGPK